MKDRGEDQGSEKEGKRMSSQWRGKLHHCSLTFSSSSRVSVLSLSFSQVTVMSQIVAQVSNMAGRRGM